MSLRLRQAIPGRPLYDSPSSLAAVATPKGAFLVYPSSTNVVLLDPDGDLHEALPFWDALPHRAGTSGDERNVGGVVSRQDMIVAWSGIHVVLWKFVGNWTVHSTIVANATVSSLDYRAGTIALGTEQGIELWRTNPTEDVVVWDRTWTCATDSSHIVTLPPERSHVAWYTKGGRQVSVQAFNRKGLAVGGSQVISLPRDIEWIGWRSLTGVDAQLYVVTANAVLRIYAPVLDDPSWFQLLYSMDSRAFQTSMLPVKGKSTAGTGTLWVPDAETTKSAASRAVNIANRQGKIVSERLAKLYEAIGSDELDVVVWFGPEGTVTVRSILNLDRKPPTLIKSEVLSSFDLDIEVAWTSKGQIVQSTSSDNLYVGFPPNEQNKDIAALRLSLADFLLGEESSLQPADPPPDFEALSVLMTQDIKTLVRTPNGRGLLAIGQKGEIGVWEKRRLGKMAKHASQLRASTLVGKGQWQAPATPCLYAIYAKGRGIASYYADENGPRIVLQHLDPGDGVPTEPVVLPGFNPEDGDEIKMLLAVSDIDDGYSPRRRRTRRAVIMAVGASGAAWVWRVDPPPTSPRVEYPQSPLSTPARRTTMVPESPARRTVTLADSPARRASALPDSPMSTSTPLRGSTLSEAPLYHSEKPIITLISHSKLPLEDGRSPRFVLPVDPMGWHQTTVDWETDTPLQDMVLTVSETGVLEFWTPRLGQHMPGHRRTQVNCDDRTSGHSNGAWLRSGIVRTDKTNVLLARCSSRKKTVLVCELPDGRHEMTVWDSNVSEFSTGLELTHAFDKGYAIQDLDWTTTSDLQSVLAVGFPHHVVLVCEQRMSYVDVIPGWQPFLHIDMRKYTSVPISDSIWLAGGSLAVGAGNQIYVFSRFLEQSSSASAQEDDEEADSDEPEDIFELIAHRNGPLFDFHPTVLHQSLLWDKIDLVKRILVTLVKDIRKCELYGRRRLVYQRLDPLDFNQSNDTPSQTAKTSTKPDYTSLFSATAMAAAKDDDEFDADLVQELVDRLDGPVLIPLTQSEKSTLAALAQATLEVEESRRSLDLCGLRYLISIRTFVNRDRRGNNPNSGTVSPSVVANIPDLPQLPMPHARISFRNIVWATHSESHHVLLQAATASCENSKMSWDDAKRLGVFLWLKSQETIQNQLEVVARNRFMADETRDPTNCSLFFFALGKKQVVHGLWRQAPGHKEQNLMLKFLANDFTTERWRTAAMKNAYALLSKQRYEYAAAFFMLAGSPKDAITICLRQLDDWQLAVALARAVEGDGPLLKWILSSTVLPIAFKGGHRWLASWSLWMLNRRDLAVRVLLSPMEEVASAWDPKAEHYVGQPDNDDPSLLLFFRHLKSKTLQTAKGASEVSVKLEFDFVLHNARVFCRMGCHPLGLDLLSSWSFDRPFFPPPKRRSLETSSGEPTARRRLSVSPVARRRSSFMLSRPAGRENMLMDMDVVAEDDTEPPTRVASPDVINSGSTAAASELFGGYTLGVAKPEAKASDAVPTAKPGTPKQSTNLMRGLREDVKQGAANFDMDQFFGPGSDSPAQEHSAAHDRILPPDEKVAISGQATPSRKVGNLMKNTATDATQGAAEFSMDSFFGGDAAPSSKRADNEMTTSGGTEHARPLNTFSDGGIDEGSSTDGQETGAGTNRTEDTGGDANETPTSQQSGVARNDVADGVQDAPVQTSTDVSEDIQPHMTQPSPSNPSAQSIDGIATTESTANGDGEGETKSEDQPRKVGNLMKGMTAGVQGATEFNMDDFF